MNKKVFWAALLLTPMLAIPSVAQEEADEPTMSFSDKDIEHMKRDRKEQREQRAQPDLKVRQAQREQGEFHLKYLH